MLKLGLKLIVCGLKERRFERRRSGLIYAPFSPLTDPVSTS
jgi:hypothetical protein